MMGGFQLSELEELNNLSYCEDHGREVCHDCNADYSYMNGSFSAFELPRDGVPQYPTVLKSIRDKQLRKLLGKRWLEMQRELYQGQAEKLTSRLIKLPLVEVPNEVRTSPEVSQRTLLQLFHQLQGIASTQRYYFANQSKIMLQEYEIFNQAAVLYKEELSDQFSRGMSLLSLRDATQVQRRRVNIAKAKANILSTFGFFLELNTQRTFWRVMELTAEAFVLHVKSFNEKADGQVVMTDQAKGFFLQWLAHFFWSLQHAQFCLNELRNIQLEVYQRGAFPFFPYTMQALESDSDIHLVIAKLSKAPVHDLPLFSAFFSKLGQASAIPEQMECINPNLMAAIDELSTRFRVMETLILVAHLVATKDEIKSALVTFKFNPKGEEVNSRTNDVMFMLSGVEQLDDSEEVPRKQSLLQKLIVKENLFRKNNVEHVMKPPFEIDISDRIPKDVFDTFKSNFRELYRTSIRRQWREEEHSLLGLDIARRFQHRLEIEKKKKKKRPLSAEGFEKADMEEVRSVPDKVYLDPSLFWEIGDGTLEKYVPPVVRKRIKTRKQGIKTGQEEDIVMTSSEVASSSVSTPRSSDAADGVRETPDVVQRPLEQLKHSDFVTRDILWRRLKGSLKWSQLVQFLSRLGCKILNLDGSKRKIVDTHSGLCTVLHRPHPGDECRPDQRESYRVHIEDWLKIGYSQLVLPNEEERDREMLDSDSTNGTTSGT